MKPVKAFTDSDLSEQYTAALSAYSEDIVGADGRFICTSGDRCRRSVPVGNGFAAGQLSHVGAGYAAKLDDSAVRVLVVSMQVGDAEAPVSMQQRSVQIEDRIRERFGQRNAHMRGVTLALQVLFGLPPGGDEETLEDGTHILDAYAMANSVLCSNLPTSGRSRRGGPTRTMLDNCRVYLRNSITILEPSVIVSQGRTRQGVSTHSSMIDTIDTCEWVSDHVAVVSVGPTRSVWCSLGHPSAGGVSAWSWPSNRYFNEVAMPALSRARDLVMCQ